MGNSRADDKLPPADGPAWRDVETQRPPHPEDLANSHTEDYLRQSRDYGILPRPDIRLPQWVRSFNDPLVSKVLVSFRTLLCPESLFVAKHVDAQDLRSSSNPVDTVDFVVAGAEFDDHGLPLLPNVEDPLWQSAAGNLLAASWFAHVQYVSELIESSLRELEAGRLTAAAVLSRAATEMAARAHRGVQRLKESETRTEQAERLQAFADGNGSLNLQRSNITKRVADLEKTAAEYLGRTWDETLYKRLCDRSHPTPENRGAYLGRREDRRYFYPVTNPLQANSRAGAVAKDVCLGVTASAAGLLALWDDVNDLMGGLAGQEAGHKYTYRPAQTLNLSAAYPEVDMESAVSQANYQMLQHTIYNDDSPTVMALAHVQRFAERWLLGHSWSDGDTGDETALAWRAVRLWVSTELLQALVIAMNRTCGASASALARFALEHLGSVEQSLAPSVSTSSVERLRDGHHPSLDREWLDKLLETTGLDVHSSEDDERSPGAALKYAANGLVHGDFSARNLYWAQYGTADAGALQLPGRPKYPQDSQALPLDHPWIIAGATVEIADALLMPALMLRPRYPDTP